MITGPLLLRATTRFPYISLVGVFLFAIAAGGQTVVPPFDASYTFVDLGAPAGIPTPFGGLTLKSDDPNTLLIGGSANNALGAVYAVGVTRDAGNHITGFTGPATLYSTAPNIDGGLAYGPGGVLFFTTYSDNRMGQIKPGSTVPDKVIDLSPLGIAASTGTVNFVASGFPDAGGIRLMSYSGGGFYSAALTPDGTGTFDLSDVALRANAGGGPEGIVWVPPGSVQFSGPSVLISEYQANRVAAYSLDVEGVPIPGSAQVFVSGLSGAEGAFIDPLTNDFLFSTFGGGSTVVSVRGFAAPEPVPVTTILYTKGDAVPGQAATFASFGLPAFDDTAVGFLATIKFTAGGSRKVIMGGTPIGVLNRVGDPTPDSAGVDSGAIFGSFKEPVFGGGSHAFVGRMKAGVGGVTSETDAGIWSSASGSLRLIARENTPAAGTSGAEWKTFRSVAKPDIGGAVFVAALEVGVAGVTPDNDIGLWRESLTVPGTVTKLLQEGDSISIGVDNETVKSFKVLGNVGNSPDHRRSHRPDGDLLVLCKFTDYRTAIIEFPGNSDTYGLRAVDNNSVILDGGTATAAKLGVPSGNAFGEAFLGTLVSEPKDRDLAIIAGTGDQVTNDFTVRVREGDFAPDAAGAPTAATFKKFRDPLFAGMGEHISFLGTLNLNIGGVTAANDAGLWTDAGGTLHLVAGEGLEAVGTEGGRFSRFVSVAVDPDASPLRNLAFTAYLQTGAGGTPGPGGVISKTKVGLWARDKNDVLYLLARTGSTIPPEGSGPTATALNVLKAASGSQGQGRSMNGSGQIIYRATRGAAGQAIVLVQMP